MSIASSNDFEKAPGMKNTDWQNLKLKVVKFKSRLGFSSRYVQQKNREIFGACKSACE